ncbi:T9SS type A sorting domain-containing protein [Pedobacter sp. BS3]|uniref:T9SS type A sorting domain-containing protein n=1 Tax=Pedobacter sp. BS3 TaxID=2567937 RepID=UPI0011EDAFC4|nr:T9SS type A sorting domain-containing protein [Pedobacter sp. BS3]TZF83000.1 T9SS type A sorting domain-containing protein [Pedobacter sp. BS3]
MKKIYFITMALIAGLSNALSAQDLLAGWSFRNPTVFTGKETEATANSSTGTTFQTQPKITFGPNLTTAGTGNSGGFGGDISSAGTIPTTFAQAVSTGTYYEIILQPKTGTTVSLGTLDFRIRREFNKSPNMYVWTYSINNTDAASFLANKLHTEKDISNEYYNQVSGDASNNGVIQTTVALTGLTNLTSTSTVYLRLYFWNTLDLTGITTSTAKGYNFALGKTTTATEGNYEALNIKGTTTLPVKLTSFTAQKELNGVKLNWQTASEENNSHFEIYRSGNGKPDELLGTVKGNGTSSSVNVYHFTDYAPLAGTNYYQLRQVDADGKYEESAILPVNTSLQGNVLKVYAGASGSEVKIWVTQADAGKSELQITDLSGRSIYKQAVDLHAGENLFSVPFNSNKGIYVVSLISGKGEHLNTKFMR